MRSNRARFAAAPPEATRLEDAPFALVERAPRGLILSALNPAARAAGLHRGQSHADAHAILPTLVSAPAEAERDREALRRLALWAERFSPLVSVDAYAPGHEGLFIDMTGGDHLFGGEAMLLADLRRRLEAAAIPARLAIADTPAAAWALARFTASTSSQIAPPGRTREALAPLPVEALRLDPEAIALLKRFGLRRIKDLYGLPRAGLARRFQGPAGLDVVRRLDQALGVSAEALIPERPAPLYRVWAAFAEPLIDILGVDIHLSRLAASLCGQLVRDGQGARSLTLTGFRVDGRVTSLHAGLSASSAAPAHLLRLLREKGLEHLDLGFGVDALMLSVARAEALTVRQGEIRAAKASSNSSPDDLAALIDRLQARLGEGAVVRPASRESWIPERSEVWVAATPTPAPPACTPAADRPRPILLLERPEPIEAVAEAPDRAPARFTWRRVRRRVVKAEGPERLSPEWWRVDPPGASPARTRDYYRVEDAEGRRYWLYREGLYAREDTDRPPSWWMQGMFA